MKITPLPKEVVPPFLGTTLADGDVPVWDGTTGTWLPGTAGVTDHGALTGLADDDHSAYETVTAGGGSTISAHGNMGATETIAPASGNVHTATANADCTITLTAPANGVACTLELYITQDGTGGWDLTWPGSVVWPGGVDPVPDTTASTLTRYVLETLDGGSTWYGVMVGGSGVSGGVPALTLGTTNAAGVATTAILTDATIAVFDATVPVTQAFSDAAATGSAAIAARRDHRHGMPAAAGVGEMLVTDGVTFPPDPVYGEDGTDFLYADVA